MSVSVIEERIRMHYQPQNPDEELNAFKEIAQDIALRGLSRTEFFKHAAFMGGTCLRIVYGLLRFSEDLDFVLVSSNEQFVWQPFLAKMESEFSAFGLTLEVKDRSEADSTVKKAFLKENSFGKVLQFTYPKNHSGVQKVLIKLEIDTNPPPGSLFESKAVRFPTPFSIMAQDLTSLFAGKLLALLCRNYSKGRDWFDFIWYITNKVGINYTLLREGLLQQGPWKGQPQEVDASWVKRQLRKRLEGLDWSAVKGDVRRFLRDREATSLDLWSESFFEEFIAEIPSEKHA